MQKFTKQQFIDWCLLQGHREFDGGNGDNCAMTQFGKAMIPGVCRSRCQNWDSDGTYNNAPLYTEEENGLVMVAHIDLSHMEIRNVVNSTNFVQAAERIK